MLCSCRGSVLLYRALLQPWCLHLLHVCCGCRWRRRATTSGMHGGCSGTSSAHTHTHTAPRRLVWGGGACGATVRAITGEHTLPRSRLWPALLPPPEAKAPPAGTIGTVAGIRSVQGPRRGVGLRSIRLPARDTGKTQEATCRLIITHTLWCTAHRPCAAAAVLPSRPPTGQASATFPLTQPRTQQQPQPQPPPQQ